MLPGHELIRGYDRKHGMKRYTIKVDRRKVFNSLKWEAVIRIINVFNFPDVFIAWLRVYYEQPMYFMIVNGISIGYFEGRNDLKQGDPVSPTLFIMVMELLRDLLLQSYQRKELKLQSK